MYELHLVNESFTSLVRFPVYIQYCTIRCLRNRVLEIETLNSALIVVGVGRLRPVYYVMLCYGPGGRSPEMQRLEEYIVSFAATLSMPAASAAIAVKLVAITLHVIMSNLTGARRCGGGRTCGGC